jgi:hypothetical protein
MFLIDIGTQSNRCRKEQQRFALASKLTNTEIRESWTDSDFEVGYFHILVLIVLILVSIPFSFRLVDHDLESKNRFVLGQKKGGE